MRSQRHFAGIEFIPFQHPLKRFAWAHRANVEVDPFGHYTAIDQGARAIVITAGECQLEITHYFPPPLNAGEKISINPDPYRSCGWRPQLQTRSNSGSKRALPPRRRR